MFWTELEVLSLWILTVIYGVFLGDGRRLGVGVMVLFWSGRLNAND